METFHVSERMSQKIATMSFVCALLVVAIHVGNTTDAWTGKWWICQLITHVGVSRIAVPFYFLCSGFLLAGHFHESCWWRREIRKRFRSLIVPLWLWGSFFYVVILAGSMFLETAISDDCSYYSLSQFGIHQIFAALSLDLFAFPPFVILWYLRSLFLVVLVSPLFVMKSKRRGICLIAFLFVLQFLILGFVAQGHWKFFFVFTFPLKGLLYFALGVFCREYDCVERVERLPWRLFLLGGILLLIGKACLAARGCAMLVHMLDAFVIPVNLVWVWQLSDRLCIPENLARFAFPIYLVHKLAIHCIDLVRGACHISFGGGVNVFDFLFRILLVYLLTYMLVLLFDQLPLRIGSILYGGRNKAHRNTLEAHS